MSELFFKTGPVLLRRDWVYDEETEENSIRETDVTIDAHEYLFDDVTLDKDVTITGIFLLLDLVPVLKLVLRKEFCEGLLVEARKGESPKFSPGYASDAIEFLELYQVLSLNTATKEYQPMRRLDLHGIGNELQYCPLAQMRY
jgi:hypothetical protein